MRQSVIDEKLKLNIPIKNVEPIPSDIKETVKESKQISIKAKLISNPIENNNNIINLKNISEGEKKLLNNEIEDYRIAISSLGTRLKLFNPDEHKNYLTNHDEDIDFIKFCNEYVKELKDGKKDKSAANFNTVKNSIVDFFKREKVLVDEINLDMLYDWERFSAPNVYDLSACIIFISPEIIRTKE